MERFTILNGEIHYFDWAIFNSYIYVTNDQRVYPINIPLNHYKNPLNHYKSMLILGMA